MILMGPAVEVEDIECGECVAILVSIHDDTDLVEEDLRIDLGRFFRHVLVDDDLKVRISGCKLRDNSTDPGFPGDRLENVLVFWRSGKLKPMSKTVKSHPYATYHSLESVNGSLPLLRTLVQATSVRIEVNRHSS